MNWLIAHLIGDYLLQNDWMALNKKTRHLPCLVHCTLYSLIVFALTLWPWWAIGMVFAAHYAQDHTNIVLRWMKFIGQKQFATGPCSPWSIIVVDNVLHLVLLYALERILTQ